MKEKIRSSLSIKVFLLTAVLMAACCAVTYLCIARFSPYIYAHRLEDAEELAQLAYLELPNFDFSESELKYDIQLYNEALETQFEGEFVFHILPSNSAELRRFDGIDTTTRYRFHFADSDVEYTVFIAKNTEKESQIAEALQKAIPVLSIVILVISIIAAFFYTVYMTTPIKRISKISKQMAALDFSGLCPVHRTDEIGVLSSSLNELSKKLSSALLELQSANKQLQADIDKERELERQRIDFFSAASHELKTPVTAVSVMLENMLLGIGKYKDKDTYLARCKELTDRLAQMIKEILDASRAEFAREQEQTDFLIVDALKAVIEPYQIIAKAKGIAFSVDAGEQFTVHLPRGMIEKAISNILANAVSYTKPDGTIYVSCKGQLLIIENECTPIPPEHLVHIFEPFYRPDYGRDRAAGGNGLGLYLVATILKSLDIPYSFSPSEDIEGMSFQIIF